MDDVGTTAVTCRGCGVELAEFHVAHFEAGRRSTTLELLCPTHGCEHHDRPDVLAPVPPGSVGTARLRDGSVGGLPVQRRRDEPEPA